MLFSSAKVSVLVWVDHKSVQKIPDIHQWSSSRQSGCILKSLRLESYDMFYSDYNYIKMSIFFFICSLYDCIYRYASLAGAIWRFTVKNLLICVKMWNNPFRDSWPWEVGKIWEDRFNVAGLWSLFGCFISSTVELLLGISSFTGEDFLKNVFKFYCIKNLVVLHYDDILDRLSMFKELAHLAHRYPEVKELNIIFLN